MFAFPTALYSRPKDLKIATLNNKLCNINYSSHKSSKSVSAKHTFTTIPACASSLLPCLPVLWQDLQGPCSSHTSVTCLMYVHDWQVTDHVSTCCHLLRWMLWLLPYKSHGKIKIKIKTGRGQRPESSNSLPSLRHITHKAHVTKSHDTSHSTRLNYVIPTFQAVHLLRHIQRFLHWHCLLGSPSGKGRGCNRYQTSHNTPILCTHAADLR